MRSILRMENTHPTYLIPRSLAICLATILFAAGSLAAATEDEDSEAGYLGVYLRKLTKEVRETYDLKVEEGVFVSFVEDDSPAEEAGIEDGDVITVFEGSRITSPRDLKEKVRDTAPGTRAQVSIVRDGDKRDLEVVVGEQPDEPRFYGFYRGDPVVPWTVPELPQGYPRGMIFTFGMGLGVKVVDLNADLAAYFKVDEGDGVLVLDVLPESVAEEAGIKAGDVITKIDGKDIATVKDLREAVDDLEPGDEFKITIVRQGKRERLEAVAESSGMLRHWTPGLPYRPGLVPHMWWLPRSFEDDLDEQMKGLQEELKELQEELDELKEKI